MNALLKGFVLVRVECDQSYISNRNHLKLFKKIVVAYLRAILFIMHEKSTATEAYFEPLQT